MRDILSKQDEYDDNEAKVDADDGGKQFFLAPLRIYYDNKEMMMTIGMLMTLVILMMMKVMLMLTMAFVESSLSLVH